MVTMTMLYRQPAGEGEFFDETPYHAHYVPGALKIAAKYRCRRVQLGRTIANREGGPDGTSFYRLTQFTFDNLEDAKAFVFSPERTELGQTSRLHYRGSSEVYYTEDEVYEYDADGQIVRWEGPGSDVVMEHVRS